ncbi:hypothetical protein SAMN06265222_1411 [Neorhodopirellula lusitana]|uniref:Uncharacterized protein n=1 Tax=Neorhodopirellula lusitana TaxID=445327 RepID=A0ABY1QTK9_9BACT|nr:hypothetical protein [Neorhodopirellula lusitana]SMP79990.1 hypothetical protein SAMN06265222_1411 [Neorhodopirellula lusitana]
MYIGLGEAYLEVFFNIAKLALLAAVVVVAFVRVFKRVRLGWLLLVAFGLWVILTYTGAKLFHHENFVRLHQSHNDYVPKTGCLTYEPSFGHLFASFSMSRDSFDAWVADFPVPMFEYDDALQRFDEDRLGFTEPDAAFATESASNGAQTRAYFKDNVMYLSRNVM